jgi:hypothetical protein
MAGSRLSLLQGIVLFHLLASVDSFPRLVTGPGHGNLDLIWVVLLSSHDMLLSTQSFIVTVPSVSLSSPNEPCTDPQGLLHEQVPWLHYLARRGQGERAPLSLQVRKLTAICVFLILQYKALFFSPGRSPCVTLKHRV